MKTFRLDPHKTQSLPTQLRALHRRQSVAAVDWLRYARRNPEVLDRSEFGYADRPIDDWLHRVMHPWPLFIDSQREAELADAATAVARLVESVPTRLFGDDPQRLAEVLGLEEREAQLSVEYRLRYPEAPLWSRADFYDTSEGLRCLELNTSSFLGGWQDATWRPIYLHHPLIRRFLEEHSLRLSPGGQALDTVFRGAVRRAVAAGLATSRELNLFMGLGKEKLEAVVRFHSRDAVGELWEQALRAEAPGVEGRVTLGLLQEAEVNSRGLYFEGQRQHILLEFYSLLSSPQVLSALDSGRLHVYNGPSNIVLRSKLHLAFLWEHADSGSDAFSAEERAQILSYLPWSVQVRRGVKIRYRGEFHQLQRLLLQRRDDMVLKLGDSYSGKGVYVGRFTPEEEWRERVNQALDEPGWMVQERIDGEPLLFQSGSRGASLHEVAWGLFAFGGQYGGGFLRIRPAEVEGEELEGDEGEAVAKAGRRGVVNVSQGALESPLFRVEPAPVAGD
ncbi:MAG: hypothetical protein AAGD01_11455 [Acidobacteriota bacterium]